MEAASEKRPRGRPKVFPDEVLAVFGDLAPHLTTTRGRQNLAYQARALSYLKDDPAYRWLYDPETGAMRATIISELGRLGNPAHIREVAGWLCRDKPKTKDAIGMVRATRRQKLPPPEAHSLALAVLHTVDRYRRQHQHGDWAYIFEALGQATHALRRQAEAARRAEHDQARTD